MDLIERANVVTNDLAQWLHDLIDDAEEGVGIAVEKIEPVAKKLQRLFSDKDDPLPDGGGG